MMKHISLFYQMILDSNYLLGVVYTMAIISITGSQLLFGKVTSSIDSNNDVSPPDLWYGCSSGQLSIFFHRIGDTRREIYMSHCYYDFFPIMPTYLILYTILSLKSRNYYLSSLNGVYNNNNSSSISISISSIIKHQYYEWMLLLLPPFVVISDIMETYIFLYAAKQFPNSISSKHAMIGNIGNQVKWILMIIIFLYMIFHVVMGYYYRSTLSSTKKKKIKMKMY